MSSQENLQQILENVTTANGYRYQVKDNLGSQTDTIKIIQNPSSSGPRYLGVHHIYQDIIVLTGSPDLLNWTRIVQLDTLSSQPTIFATSDGGFLVASEKYIYPDGHLIIRYYSNYNNLVTANPQKVLNLTGNIPGITDFKNNGGTPNIYSATLNPDIDHSSIDISFHYNLRGTQPPLIDMNGRGTITNFTTFNGYVRTDLNNAITNLSPTILIGDRDNFTYDNNNYTIIESSPDGTLGHINLYNETTKVATRLNIHTHAGSGSFSNPTVTRLTLPNGKPGIVVSYFLQGEYALSGEGGPLIFYKEEPNCGNLGCTFGISNIYVYIGLGVILLLLMR